MEDLEQPRLRQASFVLPENIWYHAGHTRLVLVKRATDDYMTCTRSSSL